MREAMQIIIHFIVSHSSVAFLFSRRSIVFRRPWSERIDSLRHEFAWHNPFVANLSSLLTWRIHFKRCNGDVNTKQFEPSPLDTIFDSQTTTNICTACPVSLWTNHQMAYKGNPPFFVFICIMWRFSSQTEKKNRRKWILNRNLARMVSS